MTHGWIAAGTDYETGGDALREIAWILGAFAVVLLAPNSQTIVGMGMTRRGGGNGAAWLDPARLTAIRGVVLGLVAVAAILGIGAKSEFLYFQF